MLKEHLDGLLKIFADTYAAEGGPTLDTAVLRKDFLMAGMDQAVGLMGSVPFIYRVIKKKDWPEVKDAFDSRIESQYLTRMYVRGFLLTFPLIFELDVPSVLSDTIETLHK